MEAKVCFLKHKMNELQIVAIESFDLLDLLKAY